jgi:hypothetical protein
VAWSARRLSYLIEAVAFVAYVDWYIWRLQTGVPASWWVFLIWLVLSFSLRGDTPKTMGWRADNLWRAARQAMSFLIPSSLLLFLAGLFLGMLHRQPAHVTEPRRFFSYMGFCLLQQVGLNSLVMNRLLAAFQKPVAPALLAGALFAALHWPNPVLVPLTFFGGTAMAWLFAGERNILPLTVVQAFLGALVWWVFPLAWHHSLRVGPGFHSAFHP